MKLFLSQFDNDLFRISYQGQTINNGNVNLLISPYVELPNDYESYLNTLSANTRQKIRRYTRQFEKSEDLHITTTSRNTLQRDLDLLVELWSTKWREYRGAKTNRYARKYRRIVEHGFDCGTVYMPILWRGETPLGIMASFVDWAKPCMYFFVSGRNVSDRSAYTGWLLHTHNIKWAIENGMKKYDLLHGNEPYKYSYGCKDHHIKCPIVKTRSRVNLNGMLDPGSIDDVEADLRRFLKKEWLGQAKTGFEQILEVHTALGNEKSMAAHYTNLGIIHQREADHAEAEKLYLKAVDLYQPLDCKEELARLYSRLGSIHISQEHLDQSRESYLKALELYKTLGSTESLANVYGNLGNIQRHLGDLDEADDYYRKSLNGYEELGNKEGMARVFANLGNLHKTKNEPEKAKADWATALTLCEEAGLESEAADLRERIADLAV